MPLVTKLLIHPSKKKKKKNKFAGILELVSTGVKLHRKAIPCKLHYTKEKSEKNDIAWVEISYQIPNIYKLASFERTLEDFHHYCDDKSVKNKENYWTVWSGKGKKS